MIKVTVIGNVGQDPQTREVNGTTVTSFSLASNRRRNDPRGPQWVRISVWGDMLGRMPIKKGSSLVVTGDLDTSEYTNKNGEKITNLEVRASSVDYQPLGSGGDRQNSSGGGRQNTSGGERSSNNQQSGDDGWDGDNELVW